MSQFNTAWLNSYEARQSKQPANASTGVDRESELHDQIFDYCSPKGWLPFHSRMDRASTFTVSAPDFIILSDNRGFYLVEAKRKDGKLSAGQRNLHAWARRLGHTVHIVRSMEEFRKII